MKQLLAIAPILIGALYFGAPTTAHATPIETFQLDSGLSTSTLGTVTITGMGANEVDVLISFAPNLVINTSNGNSHTPIAYELTSALAALVDAGMGVTVLQPVGGACSPAPAPCFAPIYGSSAISGSVNLNEGLSYSGSNGGLTHGNPGPVEFTISAAGIGAISNGMFSSFVAGGGGVLFAVDMYDNVTMNTGEEFATADTCTDTADNGNTCGGTLRSVNGVPEPASLALLSVGLLGLGALKRRYR